MKSIPKVLDHIRVYDVGDGGRAIEYRFTHPLHRPERHVFKKGNSGFIVGEKVRNEVPFLPVVILS